MSVSWVSVFLCRYFFPAQGRIKADRRVELHEIWQLWVVGGVSVTFQPGKKKRIPNAGWLAGIPLLLSSH